MNKFKMIVIIAVIALALQMINILPGTEIKAAEQTSNEEDFIIKDGVLTKYIGKGGDVVVPESVKVIGGNAFNWKINIGKSIINVTLPDTATSIENRAFTSCINLKSVKMYNSVVSIGREVFFGCENLTEISSLEGVTSIGYNAFVATPWLVERRKENPIVIINGILIDGTTSNGDVVIPKTVTSIAGYAFGNNQELMSVTIPNSVTSIGVAAFISCRNLLTVKMDNSVETLGEGSFQDCAKLKYIRLSNSLKVIETWTFAYCKNLIKITIPYAVTKIDKIAFRDCKNLKYMTISNITNSVEQHSVVSSFDNCPNLTLYGLEKSYIQSYATDNKIPFKKLAIAVTKITLAVGDTYTLKMNSLAICTWKSSNKSIATVDSYGKISAKKKGQVTITATLYGKSYQCIVTIK